LIVITGKTNLKKDKLLELAAGDEDKRIKLRILDASKVFGVDHIRSAFAKAVRAFEQKDNVSDSIATETMLYMSGCRQIQEAVAFFSIKNDGKPIVALIANDDTSSKDLASKLCIEEDDSALQADPMKSISAFGISDKEMSTVSKEKEIELILERVASVDIKKK